jgi:hypothetical protein
MLTNLRLANLRLTTVQQRSAGQHLPSKARIIEIEKCRPSEVTHLVVLYYASLIRKLVAAPYIIFG